MSEPLANPTRLSHAPEGEPASGVARLFRGARALPDEDLPKLMWRIRASQRRRAMRPRLVLRLVLVVGGVFCMGGLVGAYWERRQSVVSPPAQPQLSVATPKNPRAPAREPEQALPEPTPLSAQPAPAQVLGEKPRPAPARQRVRTRVAVNQPVFVAEPLPQTTPPSPLAVEQALIGRAMEALRDDHQPQAALALLGEHGRQFPNGAFGSEASLLRIEALLALGRKDEALSILERTPIAAAPNRDEQLVLRGELRSGNGRWIEAREDFDDVLGRHADTLAEPGKSRGLHERALWGRAAARSRLGDEVGARADLNLYLDFFPSGRFASRATRLLNAAP
jgi:hypothetical protein